MSTFKYIGEDSEGKKVTEVVKAEDRYAVYDIARQNGHKVLSIEEGGNFSLKNLLNVEKINYHLSRVSDDELVMVTRNLGSMITAGLTVTRALSVIERQSKNIKLKVIIKKIIDGINKGNQLNEELKEFPKVFSDLYVAMVKSGEESGNLSESLKTLSIQMERSSSLTKKIKGAMIYPAIVISVMVIIAILMMIFVMPQITEVFKNMNMELPATTVFIISASDLFVEHTILIIGSLISVIVFVVYIFKTNIGKRFSSWLLVRIPVIGVMVKETNSARTARTLSSLLNSGVDILQSIKITEEVVQNYYYKLILKEVAKRVEKGDPLSQVFLENDKLYPILVGEMILVGEETGHISGMLGELAVFYENEVERKTKDLSTIIEPLLMVFIGTGVGFFALAMIAPIYSISDGLS